MSHNTADSSQHQPRSTMPNVSSSQNMQSQQSDRLLIDDVLIILSSLEVNVPFVHTLGSVIIQITISFSIFSRN